MLILAKHRIRIEFIYQEELPDSSKQTISRLHFMDFYAGTMHEAIIHAENHIYSHIKQYVNSDDLAKYGNPSHITISDANEPREI